MAPGAGTAVLKIDTLSMRFEPVAAPATVERKRTISSEAFSAPARFIEKL